MGNYETKMIFGQSKISKRKKTLEVKLGQLKKFMKNKYKSSEKRVGKDLGKDTHKKNMEKVS